MRHGFYGIGKWILRNTVVSRDHLVPEVGLHLLTPQCPLWMSTPEHCPYTDPYWAFFWPGGQALTRYVVDYYGVFAGKKVLDFGCGCGASTVAALKYCPTVHVTANDLDTVALSAAALNCLRNKVDCTRLTLDNQNYLNSKQNIDFDFILIGDLFYDSEFGSQLFQWLLRQVESNLKLKVLIGR